MDPEHLRDREWREITEYSTFRANILFACVDEVHLINEWGLDFRLAFGTVGTFLRGRFPASVSIVGLTATLEPGPPMVSVCKSLGFFEGNFKLIRSLGLARHLMSHGRRKAVWEGTRIQLDEASSLHIAL